VGKKMSIPELAKKVHDEATIIDMMEVTNPGINISYFKTLKETGVTGVHFAIAHDDFQLCMSRLSKFYKMLEQLEDVIVATSASDIVSAKKKGKIAVILGIQDSVPFEKDLDLLRSFHRLGIRIVQLAYWGQNYFGTGPFVKKDSGLSDLGYAAVKELNNLGILIDLSHCGTTTALDIINTSKDPVAVTHASPSAVVEMGARAKSDELLKAVAQKEGVFGQAIWTPFCESANLMGARPTVNDFTNLLAHVADVMGVEHVGLGTDVAPFFTRDFYASWAAAVRGRYLDLKFEEKYVSGFNGIEDLVNITDNLLTHGYSESETKRILGQNWLDLVGKVWK
jgi:membrane dipeptidase